MKDKAKIIIPILLSIIAIVIFSVLASNLLYKTKGDLKRGYKVEINNAGAAKKEVKLIDIESLMKVADLKKGEKISKKCMSCHTLNKDEANKVGPNLFGIVGKKKASVVGFEYSDAMKAKGGAWTNEDLNQFLTKPKDFIPSTKMGFAGLKKPEDRANIVSYLKSISN